MLHFLIEMNKLGMASMDLGLELRPFGARSIVLSVLLGSHPPEMPVGQLLEFTALFGIQNGTVRTALSRMTANGELENVDGVYRLGGHLLDRQAQQDTGRAQPPEQWDRQWWVAIVLSDHRPLANRRTFRSRVQGARFGEVRPDTWMRPANIDVPLDLPDIALTRGELTTGNPERLVHDLWDVAKLNQQAIELYERVSQAADRLEPDEPSDEALASSFTVLASCLRYLRTEPQLPAELATGSAANDLRTRYDETVRIFQSRLAAFFDRR
jgi:phenylacetic acid degradation operon negative regulatory protein